MKLQELEKKATLAEPWTFQKRLSHHMEETGVYIVQRAADVVALLQSYLNIRCAVYGKIE